LSILNVEFDRNLDTLSSDAARSSEIVHAVKYEINQREAENPVFYASLKDREEVQREMRKHLRRLLMAQKISRSESEPIIIKLMDVARVKLG
jgi:tRNA pseudouridine-54 N-methylase